MSGLVLNHAHQMSGLIPDNAPQMSGLVPDHAPQTLEERALQLAMEMMTLKIGSRTRSIPLYNGCLSSQSFAEEQVKRKTDCTTACVPVPSSEHVAEIVGRQGTKIKSLRAKTNTYIKTPVRGNEPVFVVTGRKDDVQAAKKEILSAVDHFTQIRASRRNSLATMTSNGLSGPPSPAAPGHVKIQVTVPYQYVGLVVGPKGTTIKRIQQQTQTYIITPSRQNDPVFEVTGLAENVQKARQEIESYIALRTGGGIDTQTEDDFHRNGIDSGIFGKNSTSSNFCNNNTPFYTEFRHVWNVGGSRPEYNFTPINEAKISDFGQVSGFGLTSNGLSNVRDEGSESPSFDTGMSSHAWSTVHNKKFIAPRSRFSSLSMSLSGDSMSTVSDVSTGSSATGTNSTLHSPLPWHQISSYSDPLRISHSAQSEMFSAGCGSINSSRACLKNDYGSRGVAISSNSGVQSGWFVNSSNISK